MLHQKNQCKIINIILIQQHNHFLIITRWFWYKTKKKKNQSTIISFFWFLCLTAQQQTGSIIVPFTLEQINYFASNFFKHNHTRISDTFQFLSWNLLIYKKKRHYCDFKFSNVRQRMVQSMDEQLKKLQINYIVPKAWLWLGFQIQSHNVSHSL